MRTYAALLPLLIPLGAARVGRVLLAPTEPLPDFPYLGTLVHTYQCRQRWPPLTCQTPNSCRPYRRARFHWTNSATATIFGSLGSSSAPAHILRR